MKRLTIQLNEDVHAKFRGLCVDYKFTQASMLETLLDSYLSTSKPNKELEARISSLEIELLELRNQLIS